MESVSTDLFGGPVPLAQADVYRLTQTQRIERLHELLEGSRLILDRVRQQIADEGKSVAATVILFSGGNDSTTLAHMFKDTADYAAHANTTVGIEETRQYVRATCELWGLPLIERTPPKVEDSYRSLVLSHGFPGPGHHFKMYQRLKERSIRQIQRELVNNPRKERVIFLAGRRRDESQRRAHIPESERIGSAVWVSPLVHWTKPDLNTYRIVKKDVPANGVSDLIHMSGECLCGAFATLNERDEISHWFPNAFDQIEELEAEIADRTDIPEYRKHWGWGSTNTYGVQAATSKQIGTPTSGPMCSSCDARQMGLF